MYICVTKPNIMKLSMTKKQIEDLKVGDLFPNVFGKMKKITDITYKGYDVNGKYFACFKQEFGETSTMSNSCKEDQSINIL